MTQFHESYSAFQDTNTEVVCIVREEQDGGDGLRKIRKSTQVTFPLVSDLDANSTSRYQSFHAYLIDKKGVIRAIIAGQKTMRAAPADALVEIGKLE